MPSLYEILRVLFRHKGKMLAFFLGVLGVTLAATFLLPGTYRSQAKLFVRLGRENATLDPTATLDQTAVVAVPQSREAEINSVIEILNSRVLVEKVVDALGPAVVLGNAPVPPAGGPPAAPAAPATPAERYRAVRKLAKALDVEAVKKSNVIALTYDSPSPELSQAVLSRLVEFYLDENGRINRASGAPHFLAEQAERVRGQLAHAEDELRKLKDKTGLASPAEQEKVLIARIARLQDDLLQTTGTEAATEVEVRLLRDKLAGLPQAHVTAETTGVRNEAADLMRSQLYQLQMKEFELVSRYGETSPDVQAARRQTAAAKEMLAREEKSRQQVTTGPNRVYEETQIALVRQEPLLASLKARAETLRDQLARERDELRALNENTLRFAKLQREVDLQEAHYRKYASSLEQARIDEAMEAERISNISVAQPATYDPKAVRPNKLLNLGLGLAFAVLGALGLAWLAERLDHSLKTPEDVRTRLNLEVLAAVPRLGPPALAPNGKS